MNKYEEFFFDLNGYLIIENVLNQNEVSRCLEAIEHQRESIKIRSSEESLSRGAKALEGKQGRGDISGMLTWPSPWAEPFKELLVNPVIVPYLNELLGEGFRLDHLYGISMNKGSEGFVFHGGGPNTDLIHSYRFSNGLIMCGLIVVTWVLTDQGPDDGGFACIPGTHKSNYTPPEDIKRLETDMGLVRQIEAKAGSVIIFTEALCHGTLPWKGVHERISMLYKYSPGTLSYSQKYIPDGVEEKIQEFTKDQRAVLHPPYKPDRPRLSDIAN